MRHPIGLARRIFALTVATFSIFSVSQAFAQCSVHDHGCVYHVFNAKVQTNPPISSYGPSSLVIYAIGTNGSSGTARTDFDNHVLLPAMTGNPLLGFGYTTPTGPYINNQTSYGATHPPTIWNGSGEVGRQVYPSQYQSTFNQNTATAVHTGDFNGGENGNIPGASGCPNMPGAPNCEAVVVTGNVPNGVYQQQANFFNFYNDPNPSVDLQMGAYVTGTLRLLVPGSVGVVQTASFTQLAGTGSTTPIYSYEIYNSGFQPAAYGTAYYDQNKRHTTYRDPVTEGDHRVQYKDTLLSKVRTTIGHTAGDIHQRTIQKMMVTERMGLGAIQRLSTEQAANTWYSALNISNGNFRHGFHDTHGGYKSAFYNTQAPYRARVNVAEVNPLKISDVPIYANGVTIQCSATDNNCIMSRDKVLDALNRSNGDVSAAHYDLRLQRTLNGGGVDTEDDRALRNAEHYMFARHDHQPLMPFFTIGWALKSKYLGNSYPDMFRQEVNFGLYGNSDGYLNKK